MISLYPSKTGPLTASIGAFRIHSAYNPPKEALKFLELRMNSFRQNGTVIILGASLGYLDSILAEKRPDLRIIALHLIQELYNHHISKKMSVMRWFPEGKKNIVNFLFDAISETDLPGMQIIDWPASIQTAPDMARKVSDAISTVIRRYTGNITTTAVFGRLWIKNSLRNYLNINHLTIPSRVNGATVIAASGPSLENHLQTLSKYRSQFNLWALPSSLPALKRMNIKPDLVFSTDPGCWARLHGRYFSRDIPVAMPLTASPIPENSPPPILLNQKTIGENSLLTGNDWPAIEIPLAGTVAISAIETWRQICSGPLVLTGLDLCWYDLRSHVRPHGFDGWFSSRVNRTMPALTTQWSIARKTVPERIGRLRTGFALKTYADWFNDTSFRRPVYRLISDNHCQYPNNFKDVRNVNSSVFKNFDRVRTLEFHRKPVPIPYKDRKTWICQLLDQWSRVSTMPSDILYTLDPGGVLDIIRSGTASEHHWTAQKNKVRRILQEMLQSYERK